VVLSTESIELILNKLVKGDYELVDILDRFIKVAIELIRTTEELREEILDYEEIYQCYVTDMGYDFWIKVSKGNVTYKKGLNEAATLHIYFTKDIILKLFKKEIGGFEAYMKGLVKAKGNLSQGFRFRNFLGLLLTFLNETTNNHK
jgi:putative sterol carrier protein